MESTAVPASSAQLAAVVGGQSGSAQSAALLPTAPPPPPVSSLVPSYLPISPAPAPPSPSPLSVLREGSVSAAVSFLQNPKVSASPPSRRIAFLESKGLSVAEICEALRRSSPHSAEHRVVSDAVLSGQTASEAVHAAGLDSSVVATAVHTSAAAPPSSSAAPGVTSHLAGTVPASSNQTLYAGGQSLSPPYVAYYPAPSALYPPPAVSRDWSKVVLAAAAILGLGSSAYLLCKQYLPTVRIEYPPLPNQVQTPPPQGASQIPPSSTLPHLHSVPATTASTTAPPTFSLDPTGQTLPLQSQLVGLSLPPSGLPAFSSQSSAASASSPSSSAHPSLSSIGAPLDAVSLDRLSLRSLGLSLGATDVRTEELLLRGVSDVRSELSDIAAQLKEQAQDNRRILTALQQSIDSISRDRREEQQAAHNRALTAQQQKDSRELHSQSRQGWETPVSPRTTRLAASSSSSSPSPSSSLREKRQPSIDVSGGSAWTLTNGRVSPHSAASTSDIPPQPLLAPSSPSSAHSPLATPAVPVSPHVANGAAQSAPVDSRLRSVRSALDGVRSNNSAASALSALSSLSMYVSNVSPLHDKCRKVQLSNSNYQQRIARVQGAQDVLLACGFINRGKALEWEPTGDSEADNHLLTEAREAMASMQAAITAQQQHSSEHDVDTDAASSSAPLASPLPSGVEHGVVQSNSG